METMGQKMTEDNPVYDDVHSGQHHPQTGEKYPHAIGGYSWLDSRMGYQSKPHPNGPLLFETVECPLYSSLSSNNSINTTAASSGKTPHQKNHKDHHQYEDVDIDQDNKSKVPNGQANTESVTNCWYDRAAHATIPQCQQAKNNDGSTTVLKSCRYGEAEGSELLVESGPEGDKYKHGNVVLGEDEAARRRRREKGPLLCNQYDHLELNQRDDGTELCESSQIL